MNTRWVRSHWRLVLYMFMNWGEKIQKPSQTHTIETFTEKGIDTEEIRKEIIRNMVEMASSIL